MKLNPVVVASKQGPAFGQNEARADREKRMKAFWASPNNATLYPVGRLLAVMADKDRSIADVLADGGEIEMDSITVDGKQLPLLPGFKLSIATMPGTWGCPACRSAHGSGVYPSRDVSAKLLASCKFYYNPADKALFTISETCWGDYVKALGAATEVRFHSPNVKALKAVLIRTTQGATIM
jgi:hypothetical protein